MAGIVCRHTTVAHLRLPFAEERTQISGRLGLTSVPDLYSEFGEKMKDLPKTFTLAKASKSSETA